jgi:hypothetical protein
MAFGLFLCYSAKCNEASVYFDAFCAMPVLTGTVNVFA